MFENNTSTLSSQTSDDAAGRGDAVAMPGKPRSKKVFAARRQADAPVRLGLVLAAVAAVQFLVSLDLSVVNVGLPRIADGLGFSPVGATWVIDAYALTFGGFLLLGGKAADRFGRRRVLLAGLTVFGLASLAGGFGTAPGVLVAARATQGVGAALLAPAALALLTSTFPAGRARVRAFGVWSATNAAGGAFGVLVGGVLTQYAGWRWVLFINVPMAVAVLLLAVRALPSDGSGARKGRTDVIGAVLATAGVGLLVFGVVRTNQYGWTSPVTMSTLVGAVLVLTAFVVVERSLAQDPLLRLSLLTTRSVAVANLYNLMVGAAMASSFYFVSLYLQRVLGDDAALTGVEFVPFALGVIVGSTLAIKLGYRLSSRPLLVIGAVVTAAGFAWFSQVDVHGTFVADVLGPSVLASVGFGLCLGPVVFAATAGVRPQDAGAASALLNSSRQIGASIGLAALGTAAADRTGSNLTPHGLTSGYALGLAFSAALLLVAAVVALLLGGTSGASAGHGERMAGGDGG
jgi:EmrB/QacA subfamily drug resistance transporter